MYIGVGGVWKNVNYTNFTASTILYTPAAGTFENITATGTISNSKYLLCHGTWGNATKLINCNFNVSHQTAGTPLVLANATDANKTITAENTTIVYNNGAISLKEGFVWNETNSSYRGT